MQTITNENEKYFHYIFLYKGERPKVIFSANVRNEYPSGFGSYIRTVRFKVYYQLEEYIKNNYIHDDVSKIVTLFFLLDWKMVILGRTC